MIPKPNELTVGELNGALLHISESNNDFIEREFFQHQGQVFRPTCVQKVLVEEDGRKSSSLPLMNTLYDEDENIIISRETHPVAKIFKLLQFFFSSDEEELVHYLKQVTHHFFTVTSSKLTALLNRQNQEDSNPVPSEIKNNSVVGKRSSHVVSAMKWHPYKQLIAVALKNSNIFLYNVSKATWDGRVLNHHRQTNISSIEWAPCSGGILAVSASGGIFVWNMKKKRVNADTTLLCVLNHPSGSIFDSISWSSNGLFLAAASSEDKVVYIWDVSSKEKIPLCCDGCVRSLSWSPNGDYLFVATSSGISYIWETLSWKKEDWESDCLNCVWAPNSRCLLMAIKNSSRVFPILFSQTPPIIDAKPFCGVFDLSERELSSMDGNYSEMVGGPVSQIAWDSTGQRVAVTYEKTSRCQNELVAIFSVLWNPSLRFSLRGFVRGPPGCGIPAHIDFCSSFPPGALLCVCWDNGLLSFYPFYV